jgi:DNA replication and repair protein RecF
MFISELTLQKYRSYTKETFLFSPTVTLIVGPNTSGKTNILEGIYTLAIGKSYRAEKESDMIFWGEEVARVRAILTPTNPTYAEASAGRPTNGNAKNEETKLELVVTTGEVNGEKVPTKKYLVNGVPRRQIDFIGNIRAVLFSPGDLELVTNSPSLRRQYLNSVLVQTDREYRRNLMSYERGLRQRNRLLDLIQEGRAGRSQLFFWNQLCIKSGSYLTDKRQAFIDYVNSIILDDFHYRLMYDRSIISESRLDQYKDEEIAAGSTLVGPQRDDIRFELSAPIRSGGSRQKSDKGAWRDISRFGSRGEQRLAVLWLKLAELSYIENEVEERPILLLDDVFSELDEDSRNIVLSIIDKQQTIITSAEEEVIQLFKSIKDVKIIRLPIEKSDLPRRQAGKSDKYYKSDK